METSKVTIGSICGLLTGVLWGMSGVMSEFLFSQKGFTADWFVSVRLIISGCSMLIFCITRYKMELKALLGQPLKLIRACLGGIIGTLLFQLCYYSCVAYSNAGTATILQYLCPVMVMIYVCFHNKKLPNKIEIISVLLALAGIFLISTHGKIESLVITPKALILGILCAFFMMLSTVIPEPLYHKFKIEVITAVLLVSGGVVSLILVRPWHYMPQFDAGSISALAVAIISGGILAYLVYGIAIKNIGASKSSLLACSEIVVATVVSAIWLGNKFLVIDVVGFIMIASTVFLLTFQKNKG